MDIVGQVLYAALGVAASLLGSMAGLGGGFLMVPSLYYLGFPPPNAVAVSKFMVGVNSVVSSFRYYRRLRIPLKLYAVVAPPMIATAYIGAYLTVVIPRSHLTLIIAVILIAGSVRLFFKQRGGGEERRVWSATDYVVAFLGGGLAGLVAGLSGLGGGIVAVPVFLYILGLDPHTAVALSMMCIMPSAIASIVRHSIDGTIIWGAAIPAAVGALIGGWIGPHIALKTPRETLRKFIALLILAASLRMAVESVLEFL